MHVAIPALKTKANQNNNKNRAQYTEPERGQQQPPERMSSATSTHTLLLSKGQQRHSTVNVHFGAQRGLGGLNQGLSVLHVNEDTIADLVQVLNSNTGSLFVAVGDPDRVNAAVQQLLGFLQQGTGQDCRQDSARPDQKNTKAYVIDTD